MLSVHIAEDQLLDKMIDIHSQWRRPNFRQQFNQEQIEAQERRQAKHTEMGKIHFSRWHQADADELGLDFNKNKYTEALKANSPKD